MADVKVRRIGDRFGLDLGHNDGDVRLIMFYDIAEEKPYKIPSDLVVRSPLITYQEMPFSVLQNIYDKFDALLVGKRQCWSCHSIEPAPPEFKEKTRTHLCTACEEGASVCAPLPPLPEWCRAVELQEQPVRDLVSVTSLLAGYMERLYAKTSALAGGGADHVDLRSPSAW